MITPEKPELAEVLEVKQETSDTKTFTVRFENPKRQKKFFFVPGKFMMVTIFGFGEIPLSISSSPYKTGFMSFTVVNVGNVTNAMHSLKKGDQLGLRGPFGNGFPMQRFRKKNILFVCGGCGIAPLRSAIYAVREKKEEFGKVELMFGCKNPQSILFSQEMDQWGKQGISVQTTVDKPSPKWAGNIGVVTSLFKNSVLSPENTVALLCGPPVMIHFALIELRKKGFKDRQMFASLERMMQCGVGYCSHCNIGNRYACIDGPIFNAAELKELPVKEE